MPCLLSWFSSSSSGQSTVDGPRRLDASLTALLLGFLWVGCYGYRYILVVPVAVGTRVLLVRALGTFRVQGGKRSIQAGSPLSTTVCPPPQAEP